MKNLLALLLLVFAANALKAQEYTFQTFKDRWIINTHSVEMLQKRRLDVRITHRFGDIAGDAGGWPTFYGLETAEDVLLGFEYGATDDLSIGLFRTAGAGDLRQLISGTLKYRFVQQSDIGSPISLAVVGVGSISTMQKDENSQGLNSFEKFNHRIVSNMQLLAARKFSEGLSLQMSLGWTHRNLSPFGQENDIINFGLGGRIQVSHAMGIIFDFAAPLNGIQSPLSDEVGSDAFSPILGIGVEIETGGHVFQINLVNAQGIMPTDYIPYTNNAKWGDGQFRLGFTISRMFNL